MIEIQKLSKKFGGVEAVKDFSLCLRKGGTTGIIGPNGAGKTTIFNLISGIYKPDSGSISLDGQDITGLTQEKIARCGLGRTFQNIRLFSELSVLDNVRSALDADAHYCMAEAMLWLPRMHREEKRIRQQAVDCLEIVGLSRYAADRPGNLPYGLQRRLEIARALALSPKVLMLDEPAAGLNPEEVGELIDFIKGLRKKLSLSLLVIEHKMDFIMELCEEIYVQDFGRTIAVGTPAQIQNDERVIAAYLGGGEE